MKRDRLPQILEGLLVGVALGIAALRLRAAGPTAVRVVSHGSVGRLFENYQY